MTSSPEPQPAPEDASKRVLLLAWAIGATVTTLVSTVAAVFFYLHGRAPQGELAGWSRWRGNRRDDIHRADRNNMTLAYVVERNE